MLGTLTSRRPLDPPGVLRRILPFVAAAVLAFAPLPLPPENNDPIPILAALGVTATVVATALLVPWARLPAWTQVFPPMGMFLVVALLREAEGGAVSGYSPLLILPVFWFALYGTRFQVVLATLAAVAVLVAPILIQGAPRYPDSEWRRLIVWMAIAPVIGFTVQNLVNRVEELARTDALTDLPNRRVWEESLLQAIARARRSSEPLSVAILDLDHFKQFNDTHGHQQGDRLLTLAASRWRSAVRGGDIVARIGGEEFGVLMNNTDAAQAGVVVDRLRKATPEEQKASAGIAEWDRSETFDNLIRRADEALYEAKRQGRDRSVTSQAPQPRPRETAGRTPR